ncbi:hypothetical protein [Eisenibacter elegans]|jgi:hypothetical protein|uniref:hypothetical protein n=1 Tax=Eisenibacter elegans TaxID=997 RepID=UPI000419C8BC|nr:hypothetical protein [Eisenibacter elegans]
MEDQEKNEPTNPSPQAEQQAQEPATAKQATMDASKIDAFRELIIGPEKREMQTQIQGMKELFTAMLIENRKEYDTQVGEMKQIFVEALEQNRKVFQEQMQELYDKLPRMIQGASQQSTAEAAMQHILLTELTQQAAPAAQQGLSRLDAVKELIAGQQMKDIDKRLLKAQQEIGQVTDATHQALLSMTQTLSEEIRQMEEEFTQKMHQTVERISAKLHQNDQKQADKATAAQWIAEVAQKITQA